MLLPFLHVYLPQVPARLAELRMHMGPSATLSDVLALTKRCPQVLQVSRALLGMRMAHLCRMLGKDPNTEVSMHTAARGSSSSGGRGRASSQILMTSDLGTTPATGEVAEW